MGNENKILILEKIWSDPAPVMGGEWRQERKAWATKRGTVRLWRNPSGSITVHFNHGSGRGGDREEIFDYIQRENNLSGFWETLQHCAKCYGVQLNFTEEERKKMRQGELIRLVVPSLVASLSEHPEGAAASYIKGRGFAIDSHFGELTAGSVQRVKDMLQAQGVTVSAGELEALGVTAERAVAGYTLVLPYYRNGQPVGIKYRNIKEPLPTGTDKYKNSAGMERGGYCDTLSSAKPAVIVEGELDAIALIQSGVENVVAMSAPEINDKTAHLLSQKGINTIIYVPDIEQSKDGTGRQRTDIIDKAVRTFQRSTSAGTDLYIATLPSEGAVKMDVADYHKAHGGDELLRAINDNITHWWDYELALLEDEIKAREAAGETVREWEIKPRIMEIYNRCDPTDRQRIRTNIKDVELFTKLGITPAALSDVDEWARQTDYTNRVKAAASDLSAAVERGANPVEVAEIVRRLSETQGRNTRNEWEEQLTPSFEEELKEIQEQPDTLRTKWELGVVAKNRRTLAPEFHKYEQVEFYPADISVFCAPTSHGKTMILFQSALDLVRDTDRTFLYVSCEESKRQLLERAINVYLDIPTTETGEEQMKAYNGGEVGQNYCFIRGTRKRALKAFLRGGTYPTEYTPQHWERLSARIAEGVKRYGEQIHPRLKLIHTEGTAESIAENVAHYVEQYREQGVDVGGVFVDYMQLLTSDNSNAPRNIELKDICKALKECAARTELPIIIAAQLNRYSVSEGVDAITVSSIGEAADIERIAHDIYLVWQVDKTKRDTYIKNVEKGDTVVEKMRWENFGTRSRRIFTQGDLLSEHPAELKNGYLYVEQMKARDGRADGWGLFPFDGERGRIENNDLNKMLE